MGCGSSKSTAVHPTKVQQNGLEENTVKTHSQTTTETKISHQNGTDRHIAAKNDLCTEKTITVAEHSENRVSNGHVVTAEEIDKENLPNSRTSNGKCSRTSDRKCTFHFVTKYP